MSITTGSTFKVVTAKKVPTTDKAPSVLKIKMDGQTFGLKYGETVIGDTDLSSPMEEISGQIYLRADVIERFLTRSNSIFKATKKKK